MKSSPKNGQSVTGRAFRDIVQQSDFRTAVVNRLACILRKHPVSYYFACKAGHFLIFVYITERMTHASSSW